jgi:hypothetical protein
VTRAKDGLRTWRHGSRSVPPNQGVRCDQLVRLSGVRTAEACPALGRWVTDDLPEGYRRFVYPHSAIVSFRRGGYETLRRNRIVRQRFGDWPKEPVFAFASPNVRGEPPGPLTPEMAERTYARAQIERWLNNEE